MTERKVSVRLGIVGGKDVEAQFEQLGTRGANAMKRLGDQTEQAFTKVARSSGSGKSALQNVGFQVQDFAVQVGGGTSATQALAQQLPQLLSGLGLFGVLAGTAAAVLIPLGAAIFNMGGKAVDATKQIETLVGKINELKAANAVYSSEGIDQLIAKYGELNAAVLLLIERQQNLAETEAMNAARSLTATRGEEVKDVVESLRVFDAVMTLIERKTYGDVAAQKQKALQVFTEGLNEGYGITLDRAREIAIAFDQLRAADSVPEMADATAMLAGLLEDSKLETTALYAELLNAEDALRQLKAQGDGVNSWLDAAIAGAYDFATQLWDGARAAAAIRAAQVKTPTQEQMDRASYGAGQVALRDRMIADREIYGGNGDGLTPEEYDRINPKPRPGATRTGATRTGATRTGPTRTGARSGAGSQTNALEQEAQRIFEGTRTKAEQYATELARLEEIKAAGLITGDTYNRQLVALEEKYGETGDALAGLQTKLIDFAEGAKDIAAGIGDALVGAFQAGADAVSNFVKTGKLDFTSLITSFLADMAKLAAQKYIFGPLAGLLGGALGGQSIVGQALASILHEGGSVGGGGQRRAVHPALFAGAPRFHNGVNLGLAADEVPAILQRGERVLSRSQNKAYGSGNERPMVVNFNVKDAQSIRQSRAQMAADAARIVSAGSRNR